jgi:hypothetical protein
MGARLPMVLPPMMVPQMMGEKARQSQMDLRRRRVRRAARQESLSSYFIWSRYLPKRLELNQAVPVPWIAPFLVPKGLRPLDLPVVDLPDRMVSTEDPQAPIRSYSTSAPLNQARPLRE